MLKFSDYLNTFKKKFVCIYFDETTNKNLYEYATNAGFDISHDYQGNKIDPKSFDFHVTIFYTSNTCNIKNMKIKVDSNVKSKVLGIRLLGENEDIPVLRLDNEFKVFRDTFEELGLKDNWPEWLPHVSLSYKYDKETKIADGLIVPDFDIIPSHIMIKDQNDN
jgi:hypothetical protein